jgi:hypothetical protein
LDREVIFESASLGRRELPPWRPTPSELHMSMSKPTTVPNEDRKPPAVEPGSFQTLRRQAERGKDAVTRAVEGGLRDIKRHARRGRYAVEDLTEDVRLRTRRTPLRAIGLAFAAGALAGGLLALLARGDAAKRRLHG